MAWVCYDKFMEKLFNQTNAIDLNDAGTTVKCALVTNSYSPTVATDEFWGTPDGNEVSGTNYTAGGNAIANKTVTLADSVVTFDADDPATWAQSGAGFSDARYAILYKDSGDPATSPLIAYHNFGSDKGNVSGDLIVSFHANGIITLSKA